MRHAFFFDLFGVKWYCNQKKEEYKNFSVITGKFENISFADFQYDLVYSASAFYWIPENIGYPKVYAMLKSGGVFARFANHPYRDKGNPALSEEIDKLYSIYYYGYYGKDIKSEKEYSEEQAVQRAQIAEKYGFVDIKYAMFHRTRTFLAKEYIELLGTYSDHIAIEEKIRMEFFSKIQEAINKHGGSLTIYDTMDLLLARKPKDTRKPKRYFYYRHRAMRVDKSTVRFPASVPAGFSLPLWIGIL